MTGVETLAELGGRIREARLAQGLSQGELAHAMSVDRSALVRIESGQRKVTALELIRLSDALQVPVAHFVHRSPQAVASRRKSLEDDPLCSERTRYRLDALLEGHLRDAEALRAWGYLQPKHDLPVGTVDSGEAAREFARQTRRHVGHAHGPLPSMAEVAEQVGLYLLVADADAEGSSLTPELGFGVTVIGGSGAPGRRRFTAAHEAGHHLLGDEYQSDAGVAASRGDREQQIDVFAGELLLPMDDVSGRWDSLPGDAWERLLRLAHDYRVSWAVVVRVARSAEVLPPQDADRLHARTPQLGDFIALLGSGPEEDLRVGATGPAWRQAVLRAYVDAKITGPRAVEMLHGALSELELPSVPEPAQ